MIKQPIFIGISAILLFVVVYFVFERTLFLKSAKHTQGSVTSVESVNDTCGSRRRRYSCTRFDAVVRYPANGTMYNISLSAGSSRGYNQPVSNSRLKMGELVGIVYDPKNPNKAYEDTFWGVWGAPVMCFFFQIASFIAGFLEPRRRRLR